MVDPPVLSTELLYQSSSYGLKSTSAIAHILAKFRRSRLKVPTCVRVDRKLVVLDGQHTAVACASHSQITVIPVLIGSVIGRKGRPVVVEVRRRRPIEAGQFERRL